MTGRQFRVVRDGMFTDTREPVEAARTGTTVAIGALRIAADGTVLPGSGGTGQWRAGEGPVRRLRFNEPLTTSTYVIETPGDGGYGPPRDRPRASRRRDR
ncbi:hypothetical protein ACW4TU_38110 [Streptomyces sp. QTS52]